ncbi:MAG: stage V sporulation protein AC [Acutalibacteraceae bacterium]
MKVTNNEYNQMAKQASPKSPVIKDCVMAFLFGGFICTLGQLFYDLYQLAGMTPKDARTVSTVTLIAIAVILTGIGVFDNIAKLAGAGTLVPITGFANSVAAPAIEFKSEGFVLGVGAKLFTIAGPVIAYGTLASMIYGLIIWLFRLV